MLPKSIGSISVPKRQYYGSTDNMLFSHCVAANSLFATFTPYLNRFNDDIKLFANIFDPSSLQLEGMVGGFLDGIAVWVREIRRKTDEQSSSVIELEQLRTTRCLEHFEKLSDRLDQQSKFNHIMLGCTLGIMEARLTQFQWRQKHLRLANWYDEFSSRSSMQATVPEA